MKHPARYSDALMPLLAQHIQPGWRVLDPFAGSGRIHELVGVETVGIEIEPEWATMHPRTLVGNALRLDEHFAESSFDAVCTSPCYGNRMADAHEAKDDSRRITYRHVLGRKLTPGSTAGLQFGPKYRQFHETAWWQVARVLAAPDRPRLFVLNTSNHIRAGREVEVTEWHHATLERFGFERLCEHRVETPRMGFGANGSVRVAYETVACFRGPVEWSPAVPGCLV